MKKAILILLSLFISTAGFAAPAYGPQMPRQMQIFGGLQSYSIFNRKLEGEYGKMRSQQEFALLSVGIFDWLSLDLKGGAGNIRQRSGPGPDIDYTTFLGGGYGFRLKLYDNEETRIIFGFQHISIHPFSISVNGIKNKAVLDDWQFSLLASHQIGPLNPYIGPRWGWMNQIHWTDTVRKLEKSDLGNSVGLIVGTDIPVSKKIWLNVEGQFFDAAAIAGSINFAF